MPGATTSSFFASSPNVGTEYPAQLDSNTEPVTGNTKAPSSFYQDGGGNYAQSNPDEAQTFVTEAQAAEAAAAASASSAAASASTATTEANTATTQATSASTNAGIAYTNAQSAQTSATNAGNSASAAASSATTATTEAGTATTQANNASASASAASTSATNASNSASAAATSATNAANSASTAASSASSITGIEGQPNGIATLDSGGHLSASQIPLSLVGALQYQGVWNASTNSPTLTSGTGTKGQYYKVSVAGSTTVDGNSTWNVGDSIIFDGTTWDKIDGISSEVVSVAGRTGVVTLAVGDVSGAAPLASPALTGTPTAPTQATTDNSTNIATSAFVKAVLAAYETTSALISTLASYATLASPALTGTPTAPTATNGTNTTQIATTAFVEAAVTGAGVSSIAGATGAFTLANGLVDSSNALGVSLSKFTNALSADVAMTTANAYFDGPSVAQGSTGTWLVIGSVTFEDPTTAVQIRVKLWDGTNVLASTIINDTVAANATWCVTLAGISTSPAGNLRMSAESTTATSLMKFNSSGNSKDCTITAVRII